jgi:hypothetical protein
LRSIEFVLHGGANKNRWITNILSQVSSGHLEHVAFQLHRLLARADFDLASVVEWSSVDVVLQRSVFSRLRNVEVRCDKPLWIKRPFSVQVMEQLPRCHARGVFFGW